MKKVSWNSRGLESKFKEDALRELNHLEKAFYIPSIGYQIKREWCSFYWEKTVEN